MTTKQRLSQLYKNALLRQYKNGSYTVEGALLEAEKMYSRNRFTEQDYEEIVNFLAEEMERIMQEEVEKAQEAVEEVENSVESEQQEDTTENETTKNTEDESEEV